MENIVKDAYEGNKIDFIKTIVANVRKMKVSDYDAKNRKREVVMLKYIAMYLIYKKMGLTFDRIAGLFGYQGKEKHTATFHAIKQIENLTSWDSDLRQEVNTMESIIDRQIGAYNMDKIQQENHYFDLNNVFVVKLATNKSVIFAGHDKSEVEATVREMFGQEHEIFEFNNTNMFLMRLKTENE